MHNNSGRFPQSQGESKHLSEKKDPPRASNLDPGTHLWHQRQLLRENFGEEDGDHFFAH